MYFEKTIETAVFYDPEDIRFDDTYTLRQDGTTYVMELKESETVEAPISGRRVTLQYSQTFIDRNEEEIPKSVKADFYEDGSQPTEEVIILKKTGDIIDGTMVRERPAGYVPADGEMILCNVYHPELPLTQTKAGEKVWIDFAAPMTFTDYGAAYYKLADGVYMPHSEEAPVTDGFEDEILSYLDLSPSAYRISYAAWSGDTYTNGEGILCRNALLYGERLVGTTVATYSATIDLEDVTGYKGIAVYSFRGIVRNPKKVAAVAGGSAAAVGAGTVIPIVFFRRRRRKADEDR